MTDGFGAVRIPDTRKPRTTNMRVVATPHRRDASPAEAARVRAPPEDHLEDVEDSDDPWELIRDSPLEELIPEIEANHINGMCCR